MNSDDTLWSLQPPREASMKWVGLEEWGIGMRWGLDGESMQAGGFSCGNEVIVGRESAADSTKEEEEMGWYSGDRARGE